MGKLLSKWKRERMIGTDFGGFSKLQFGADEPGDSLGSFMDKALDRFFLDRKNTSVKLTIGKEK